LGGRAEARIRNPAVEQGRRGGRSDRGEAYPASAPMSDAADKRIPWSGTPRGQARPAAEPARGSGLCGGDDGRRDRSGPHHGL